MSILLEALRKSEKNQQPHEVPTIHAEDQSDSLSEAISAGPLALLLVAALFASGWFVWQQYRLPAGSYQPPVTLSADQIRAPGTAVTTPVAEVADQAQASLPSPVASDPARQERTPVETYQQVIRNISRSNSGETATSTPSPPAVVPDRAVAPAQDDYRRHEPAPIGYWELPDAVRAEVPEIKFSVLVYASNPDDRFVLINGQRLGEGDSVQSGLVVEEIRREGVLFSYRLYRFLIER